MSDFTFSDLVSVIRDISNDEQLMLDIIDVVARIDAIASDGENNE